MGLRTNRFWPLTMLMALTAGLSAQAPQPQPPAAGSGQPQTPTFRVQIDAVTMDVIVKDSRGQFVPDLTKNEFEVFEDGVKQEIVSMTMSHGGRVSNLLDAPPPALPEGIILPPRRRVNDTSGRIFLFFVDDLHLQFQASGRVRELFKKISRTLLHDGDMFGIVSSGPSSIAIDMTYDRRRVDEAINKIAGDGLKPSEIIQQSSGPGGPSELRHRANVAFATMREGLENLEKVTNRRKALVWVSEGYDFNPFQESRLGLHPPGSPYLQNSMNSQINSGVPNPDGTQSQQTNNPLADAQKQSETFSDADLAYDLAELTRAANRANTTIYTIDPRGLIAGTDIDEPVNPVEWNAFVRKSQDTMRVLAEDTGGLAIVNQNDFDKALKQIDAESSDYYVLGYYSTNPDPTKRRRQIEVRTTRKDVDVYTRKEYVLKAPPRPVSTAKP
jgi:VWFA-related protein